MVRGLALALLVAAGGCSAVLKFHECDTDKDCVGQNADGGMLYCSDDHMCVGAIPDYQLCKVEEPEDGVIPSGALVIGGLYRVSGDNDVNDHAFKNAANLAAAEINGSGAGYKVANVVCDTAGDPAQAARAYRVVVERFHASVVVGPDTSDEVFAVAKEVKARGALVMSPSATNPGISGLDDDGLIWRTAASDNLQAKVLASLPVASAKLDILYVSDSNYANGLKDAFVANYPGTQPPGVFGFTGGNTAEMNAAVQMASADAPGFALLIADFDAPPLISAVNGAGGLTATQFLMTDSAKKPSLWGQLPGYGILARVRGTGPANPKFTDPSGMAFSVLSSNYMSRYMGEDPAETAFVSNTYDAFYAVAIAGLSLGSTPSGKQIAERLARVSDSKGTRISVGQNGLTSAITTLQGDGTIDLVGTSGPIDFLASGDIASAPIEIWSVDVPMSGAPTFHQDDVQVP
jgi:branched-chain amino acid transport system substrate-binding protein